MARLHSGRLAIFQACAIDDARLGSAAFRVLAALGTYSDEKGWCYPRQEKLADRLGVGRQAVSKQLQVLARLGYIEIQEQHRADGGRRENKYRLVLDYELPDECRRIQIEDDEEAPQREGARVQPHVDTPQPDVAPPATSRVATPQPLGVATRTSQKNDPVNDPEERAAAGARALEEPPTLDELEVARMVRQVRGMGSIPVEEIVGHLREVQAARDRPATPRALRIDALKFRDYWNARRRACPQHAPWKGWRNAMTNWFAKTKEPLDDESRGRDRAGGSLYADRFTGIVHSEYVREREPGD